MGEYWAEAAATGHINVSGRPLIFVEVRLTKHRSGSYHRAERVAQIVYHPTHKLGAHGLQLSDQPDYPMRNHQDQHNCDYRARSYPWNRVGGREGLLDPKSIDLLLLTHGHEDHLGNAAAISKETGARR